MTMDERFDRIDRPIQALTQTVDALTQYVLDFRQETASRFQTVETRLDVLSATVASIDSRFPALTKAILYFGTLSSQLVREQTRQKDTATSLCGARGETASRIVERAA